MKPGATLSAAILAVAISTATTLAQSNFTLNLTLTARKLVQGTDANGHPVTTLVDAQTGGSFYDYAPGDQFVVELRYRITAGGAPTTPANGSLGLASANIHISGSSSNGSFSRFTLTNFLNSGTDVNGNPISGSVLNPDNSGPNSAGYTGLVNLFRGGLTSDSDPANGSIGITNTPGLAISGFSISPHSLSAPNQNSFTGSYPTSPNFNSNTSVWAIYDFLFTPSPTNPTNTISASAIVDPLSGAAFSFYEQQGTVINPTPVASMLSYPGTISFSLGLPSPHSAALLSLGALLAARRRR